MRNVKFHLKWLFSIGWIRCLDIGDVPFSTYHHGQIDTERPPLTPGHTVKCKTHVHLAIAPQNHVSVSVNLAKIVNRGVQAYMFGKRKRRFSRCGFQVSWAGAWNH